VWEEAVTLAWLAAERRELAEAERILAAIPMDTLYLEEVNRLAMKGRMRFLAGGDPAPFCDSLLAIKKPGLSSGAIQTLGGIAYLWKGDQERGWQLLDEALSDASSADDQWLAAQVMRVLASANAIYGRPDEALSILEQNVAAPATGISAASLQRGVAWDALRDDPRFAAILERCLAYEEQAASEAEAEGPWLP
jgi:hypothetical protein